MQIPDISSVLSTTVFAGIITLAIYVLFISPLLPTRRPQAAAPVPAAGQAESSSTKAIIIKATRVPSHVSEPSARMAASGGSNLLSDGMVAFRHTKASSYEQECLDNLQQTTNRTERAKILAKLMLYTEQNIGNSGGSVAKTVLQSPPAKGTVVIISVPAAHVGGDKLRRVLYLLGTYYTVVVILGVSEAAAAGPAAAIEERTKLLQQLRGDQGSSALQQQQLPTQVIPDHRIILSSTPTGRIALVRQMERVELVLDYDSEVETQLRRFKHKAITYGTLGLSSSSGSGYGEDSSVLGNELLS